ncbi:MAG: methylated-DNA--[protein]-cysteine S-methyltransferase [Alphaproteobacteria bacterium]|nr:methylated-DNA--[protein]-cysteine S-methyltransferase [Alphaproteobacteria bacterium]
MDYLNRYISPLGNITLTSDGSALTGLRFGEYGEGREKELPAFDTAKRWLDVYFKGVAPDFTPPLNLRGSGFRKGVWEILLTIPFGKTMTYGQIAACFSARMSAQAVGGAVGHNPVELIVPCHRVIGANGNLTGYAGGLDKKIRLLELEKAVFLRK